MFAGCCLDHLFLCSLLDHWLVNRGICAVVPLSLGVIAF